MWGRRWLLRSAFFQYNVYKRHDDLQVQKNIYKYIYNYIKIDNGGTKTMLGPAHALRTRAGKTLQIFPAGPKAWFRISCIATGSQCKRTTKARIEPSSILAFARAFTLTSGRNARYSEPGLRLFWCRRDLCLFAHTGRSSCRLYTLYLEE